MQGVACSYYMQRRPDSRSVQCLVNSVSLAEKRGPISCRRLSKQRRGKHAASVVVTIWILGSVIRMPCVTMALSPPLTKASRKISNGFQQRVAADPSFPMKSISELLLAAGTQLTAEWNRRGAQDFMPELDFVVAGVITAMLGKYYSMWRVAPTQKASSALKESVDVTFMGVPVPTNAFQPTMIDGRTRPTPNQRFLAIFAPMPSLFRAGFLASAMGYGFTGAIIWIRSLVLPSFVAATRNVNVVYASIYTGAFLAVVSNLRYQVLQGILEPKVIDKLRHYQATHSIITFFVRMANGFLGSLIAIVGMRYLGLQQRK